VRADRPKEGADDSTPVVPPATAFLEALERELGIEAISRLNEVVLQAATTPDLPDDAFGPCFKKVNKKIQREQPGEKKRETVDGFTWSLVPKPPANCGGHVGGLQKTP
jgi:hypothetical protein